MRLQGKIIRWDDDRGFGFVSWHGDESTIFVHIKAFTRNSRRPQVGDIVTYEVGKSGDGKPRAVKVRFSDQTRPRKSPARRPGGGLAPVIFATIFIGALIIAAVLGRISWLLIAGYLAASLVTFMVYGWDKSSARQGRWRTPESTLHFLGLIGGWPGGLAAQRLLRHKSSKREFQFTFWLSVLVNVAFVSHWLLTSEGSSIRQMVH